MQFTKTVNGKFLFTLDEWILTSQIRSYFSRLKAAAVRRNSSGSLSNGSQSNVKMLNTENNSDEDNDEDEESFDCQV